MRIYLSSTFFARDDRTDSLLALRQDIKRRGEVSGIEVLLGEDDADVVAAERRGDALGVLEGCARLMARADAFLGFLFERHGTGIALRTDPVEIQASVSFFEAELLHASMTRKPILIAKARGFTPNAALAEFLRLVAGSLGSRIVEVDRSELPQLFDDYCRSLTASSHDDGIWLFDRVSIGRIRRTKARELNVPELRFLGGALGREGAGAPDAGVISEALVRVDDGIASDGRPLGQLERLTYLWVAMKELAKASVSDRQGAFRPALERALERWSSSAAWYGLHGSHPMGCLATLNELTIVRGEAGSDDLPLGPRSSAYYSIGARLRSRRNARRFFHLSLGLSHRALGNVPDDPSGLLQMSASAEARLSSLGEPWRYLRALDDFRTSYEWRSRNSASYVATGEAMNAYAYALFRLPWRRRDALRLAEDATPLLLSGREGASGGLYLRGEHKCAEMLWSAGRQDEAVDVASSAGDAAQAGQAFDQERQLRALVAKWQPSELPGRR